MALASASVTAVTYLPQSKKMPRLDQGILSRFPRLGNITYVGIWSSKLEFQGGSEPYSGTTLHAAADEADAHLARGQHVLRKRVKHDTV